MLPPGFFAYVLQSCPWSHAVANLLSKKDKKWVRRNSKQFHALREKYKWPTYPIVLYQDQVIGGHDQLMFFTNGNSALLA